MKISYLLLVLVLLVSPWLTSAVAPPVNSFWTHVVNR